MDTDTTIKQLMKPYNMKVDKMKQDKQVMQWKQEMMRDIIKELRGLKNDYLNIDSPDATNMMKAGSFSVANITSSNEGMLTAMAMPGAVNIPSQVSVEAVAKTAKISVGLKITNKEKPLSTTMSELGYKKDDTIELKYEGKSFSLKVVDTVGANEQGTIGKDETLQEFINKFSSLKVDGVGTLYEKVKISFSELTGELSFETRETGKDQNISLNIIDSTSTIKSLGNGTGQEAVVYIKPQGYVPPVPTTETETAKGIKVTKSKNDFTIDNICYRLNQNAVNSGTTTDITLTSKSDAQKSVDKIKVFVDKYNAIVDKMYAKYSEKKQYKLSPLTDEQKIIKRNRIRFL